MLSSIDLKEHAVNNDNEMVFADASQCCSAVIAVRLCKISSLKVTAKVRAAATALT